MIGPVAVPCRTRWPALRLRRGNKMMLGELGRTVHKDETLQDPVGPVQFADVVAHGAEQGKHNGPRGPSPSAPLRERRRTDLQFRARTDGYTFSATRNCAEAILAFVAAVFVLAHPCINRRCRVGHAVRV